MHIDFSISRYAGMILTLLAVAMIGVASARGVRGARDFQGESRGSGSAVVMGAIVGTLIGGSSTIGTAQLAYSYGVSACWFTVGSTVACLLLGLLYCRPLYNSPENTASGIIRREFGPAAGRISAVINAGGMFIALLAQLVSASAVWAVVFPGLGTAQALALTVVLVILYVAFGGMHGVGLIGVFKLALLYLAVFGGGWIALRKLGGFGEIAADPTFLAENFFNPLARGWSVDTGSALSAALGCLGSQSYVQAIRSGRSVKASRRGALASAAMIPPIGLGGILIGLYMRKQVPALADAGAVLPYFLLTNTPDLVCGIVLGALLITVIGASAGIVLGISSLISNDFVRVEDDRKGLLLSRLYIVGILAVAALVSSVGTGNFILDYSFLGLGVRAVSCVIAYTAALFFAGKCRPGIMVATMIFGPAAIVASWLLELPIDPLMAGYGAALLFLGAALWLDRMRRSAPSSTD